eukprot:3620777-Pleurochrysis_carterae.AAC.2
MMRSLLVLVATTTAAASAVEQPQQTGVSTISRSKIILSTQQSQPLRSSADSPVSVLCLRGGATKCDVWLIGCGVPKRGMGWYHAKQILEGDVPTATLTAVVEPWFLGGGKESPPGQVSIVDGALNPRQMSFCVNVPHDEVHHAPPANLVGRVVPMS